MPESRKIVILGAGPTGLGAAWRLQELGDDRWELFEAQSHPGGLSASVSDHNGFTWDLGVHIMHSHYEYLDRLLDDLLPGGWLEHVRKSWIWLGGQLIAYPLQHHIGQLSEQDQRVCLDGLREAVRVGRGRPAEDFGQWLLQRFGRGLADIFLFPFNRKVWACEPGEMGVQWVGERVATINPAEVLQNALAPQDKTAWGPNALFRYPRQGGIGTVWDALFRRLAGGADAKPCVSTGKRAVRIDPTARVVEFADGTTTTYDTLISTMPLDELLGILSEPVALKAAAAALRRSCLHVIGVGLAGRPPEAWKTASWIYYPQPQLPFHRITIFSNLSPQNVPDPIEQWSLQAEVSERPEEPMDASQVIGRTMDGLRAVGVFGPQDKMLSVFHQRLEHAYPTPLKNLDAVLRQVLPALETLGVFSRGRFGAWKYEVGNMDHSFMQGVEIVDRLLQGTPEKTLRVHG